MIDIIEFVPTGEQNALNARAIWQRMDCWAQTTIKMNLDRLWKGGKISRRKEPLAGPVDQHLYWREAA